MLCVVTGALTYVVALYCALAERSRSLPSRRTASGRGARAPATLGELPASVAQQIEAEPRRHLESPSESPKLATLNAGQRPGSTTAPKQGAALVRALHGDLPSDNHPAQREDKGR